MNLLSRVIHRVEPFADESVTGFLMRVAYENNLKSSLEVIRYITGSKSASILYNQIPEVAYFCRNTVDEFLQLSGFEKWENTEPRWLVQGEWLTKSLFVHNRTSKVCPVCISESPHVRGLWSLSFYTHCAWHECALQDRCPKCRRTIKWDRHRPDYCNCLQYLGAHPLELPQPQSLMLAKLIAYRVTKDSNLIPAQQNNRLIEYLVRLSIDGICKTIWFLGHCIPELGQYSTGHGKKRPDDVVFEGMVRSAFDMLKSWPDSMGLILERMINKELCPQFSSVAFHYFLRPLDHYMKSSLDSHELGFIGHVYEQSLQQIWLKSGRRNSGSRYEKQLRLEF